MASMGFYSKAAMERAMKVQEVILRAMAKKITWWQAAEIIGISDRHQSLTSPGFPQKRPAIVQINPVLLPLFIYAALLSKSATCGRGTHPYKPVPSSLASAPTSRAFLRTRPKQRGEPVC
jgi:hypothetical protein